MRAWFSGLVADVAGHVLLLEPADAVPQARRARQRPGPRELVVAQVGHELARRVRLGGEAGVDLRQVGCTSGSRQGSDELARKVSESRITGVR